MGPRHGDLRAARRHDDGLAAYRLDLVPGSPTSYRYGTETRELVPTDHEIEVMAQPVLVASAAQMRATKGGEIFPDA